MNYYLAHFSPETWDAFHEHGRSVMGFPKGAHPRATKVAPGDVFICYLLKFSRWCGALEVLEGLYADPSPIFAPVNDKYLLRFRVKPLIVLDARDGIPIDELWNQLNRTRKVVRSKTGWARSAQLTRSLAAIDSEDGRIVVEQMNRRGEQRQKQTS